MAKGLKTGGRKKGIPNKIKGDVEQILYGMNCDPIAGLARIGKANERDNPQVAAFCYAKLANKVHPDKRAVEHSGEGGGPIQVTISPADARL